jgi:hypothetical protein
MTYVEAMSEIQKCSIDALKVVQSTQIASLAATRDLTAALIITPPLALFGVPPLITAMANLTSSIAFALLEGQIACAKSVTETLVAPMRTLSAAAQPLALTGEAAVEVLPAVSARPVTAPRETVVDVEPIDEAILVEAIQPIDVSGVSEVSHVWAQETSAAPASTAEVADVPAVEFATAHAEVAASPAAALDVVDEPSEAVALTTDVAEPAIEVEPLASADPQSHFVEPPSVGDEQFETAELLANMLPPPDLAGPGPAAPAPSKAAVKKKEPAGETAAPNAHARSKRRPSK